MMFGCMADRSRTSEKMLEGPQQRLELSVLRPLTDHDAYCWGHQRFLLFYGDAFGWTDVFLIWFFPVFVSGHRGVGPALGHEL